MRSTPQALLSRVRNPGDHDAWRAFDTLYRGLLVAFCRRRGIAHIDAEDIVQHVFVSLSKTLPDFAYDPQRGRFRDYLYRAVRNVISDWCRRPERRDQALFSDIERSLGDSGDGAPAAAAGSLLAFP